MGFLVVVLALVCAILTIGVTGVALNFNKSDAAGRGMAAFFGLAEAVVLWILLALFIVLLRRMGRFTSIPTPWLALLFLAVASGGIAAAFVLFNLDEHSSYGFSLRIFVAAGPTFLLAYGLLERFAILPQNVSSPSTIVGGIIVAILTLGPWLEWIPAMREKEQRQADQYEAWEKRQAEEKVRLQELQAVSDFGKLTAFLPFTDVSPFESHESKSEALMRIKKLPGRQEEAEALLKTQDLRVLAILTDIDIQATPGLVEGTKASIRKMIKTYQPATQTTSFDSVKGYINQYMPAVRWLRDNGYMPKEEIAMIREMVGRYPDSSARRDFIAGLDYYLEPPSPNAPRF
jgi:hypothetical protein